VLIDNFKTGTLEKWGIGYEAVLKHRFPQLVHCRISGFGEAGPLGGAPGYDAVVQAMTGMMSINGMAESGSVRLGAPIVDMGTGLYCVIGILMALHERQNSRNPEPPPAIRIRIFRPMINMPPRQMTFSSALAITAHFGGSVMRLAKVASANGRARNGA